MSQIDQNSFLYGSNATFIAELYARYVADPASVEESWRRFFAELQDDQASVLAELRGPDWAPNQTQVIGNGHANGHAVAVAAAPSTGFDVRQATLDSLRAINLIRAYRVRGHLEAQLDPLGLMVRHQHPELDPATYGF